MDQNLIGINEMANKLDVPVSWLYSRTRINDIPHYKVGKYVKFDSEKVMQWIQEQNESELERGCAQIDASNPI
jgi:excisionase family DNA binding protein